jgi:uncharacterized repeat protein (TIGR01451 family)
MVKKEVKKMIRKTAIFVAALLAAFLCIALLSPFASAQPCDHNVTVLTHCCGHTTTEGWFYNVTGWHYSPYCAVCGANHDHTPLFHLNDNTDEEDYYGFCINYTVPIDENDVFNASICTAEPTCKNNSIAYILNNWTIDCDHCANVSAGQSAVWYFTYIDESFCRDGMPTYDHNTVPPGESNWIPNCTAHPEACTFINASINQSVPYNVTISPGTGNYVKGTPIELEATVTYCLGAVGEEVTVVFETDTCTFSESGGTSYENKTSGGKLKANLTCDASVDSVNVTAGVKDMKWFEIVDPIDCQLTDYQPTLRIINLTGDANFSFHETAKPGTWDGYVYEDPICNCSYDEYGPAGPNGVPNVNVSLHNASGWEDTTKTNASGYYLFTNLTPGHYWARYNKDDLPDYLTPKCDDDTPEGGSPNDIITSEDYMVPEGGSYRHNFAVESEPDILIIKKVNGEDYVIATRGETVTFTLTITNIGPVNITNLSVTDALPLKKHNKGLASNTIRPAKTRGLVCDYLQCHR